MTREELVEVVARAIRTGRLKHAGVRGLLLTCSPDAGSEPPDAARAAEALTVLCAALNIPPAALDALAAGEACVVPARGGITAQMEIAGGNVLDFKAVEAMAREEWLPDDAARRIYRAMVAASPYAAPDAEGGA